MMYVIDKKFTFLNTYDLCPQKSMKLKVRLHWTFKYNRNLFSKSIKILRIATSISHCELYPFFKPFKIVLGRVYKIIKDRVNTTNKHIAWYRKMYSYFFFKFYHLNNIWKFKKNLLEYCSVCLLIIIIYKVKNNMFAPGIKILNLHSHFPVINVL